MGLARRPSRTAATVQFYVNLADNAALDPSAARWGYAVFGKVVQGMDVVDKIGDRGDRRAGRRSRRMPRSMQS